MASKTDTPNVRWRESRVSEPGPGGIRTPEIRVVEGPEAPAGATLVNVEPFDWTADTKSD